MKIILNRYVNLFLAMSRATLLTIGAMGIIAGLMFYRLNTLTPGLSEAEINTYQSASSLGVIGENMVNAPYKLAMFFVTHVFESAFGLRIIGASLGAVSIIVFYLLARRLFNGYISLATTAMFATSSLLLSVARQATPNVMLLSLLALIGTGFYLRFSRRHDIGWILSAVVVGLTLYVPGMVFFILAAALWQFRSVHKSFEQLKTPIITIASVTLGLLIAPLIISLIREPQLWRAYLDLPAEFAPINEMAKYAGTAVVSLFAMSPHEPTYWLGRQPVLDVLASVMFVYGLFVLAKQYRLDRLWTLGGIFLMTLVFIGVTTDRLAIVLLLPFVYIVVGIGMQHFINQWTNVFPRNPIARILGGVLLLSAIMLSINFQSHRYFVAWPNNYQTKAVFNRQFTR
jgi:4-amino-4-deoxy-L-arabinose transferase-like glycosyltransferase